MTDHGRFEDDLRAKLAGLRTTPELPAVERGLGHVLHLGRRRRRWRRISGAAVVVAAVVLVAMTLGGIDDAADLRVRLGGPPARDTRSEPTPSKPAVDGQAQADVTTTVTTGVTPPGVQPEGGGPEPSSPAGPRASIPVPVDSPSVGALPPMAAATPPTTAQLSLPVPHLPEGCVARSLMPLDGTVPLFDTRPDGGGAGRPQCHVVRRGSVLRIHGRQPESEDVLLWYDFIGVTDRVPNTGNSGVAVLNIAVAQYFGPVDTLLPAGQWHRVGEMLLDHEARVPGEPFLPFGELWLVAV